MRILKPLLFVCIWFSFAPVWAQTDSLVKALESCKVDTIKLKLLTDLNWEYLGTNLAKSQEYAEQELELAQQINNKTYIAQAYNDFGIVCIKKSNFKEGLNWHKKALEIRLTLYNPLDIASSYSKIGYCYSELDLYGLALQNQLLALKIYRQLNDKVKTAFTLNNLCYLYTNLYNWDKEIELANQAYSIGLELNDENIKAVALNNIGSAFEKKKDYKSAIRYKLIALKAFEKLEDSTSMATMMNNVGYYYRNMGKDQEAEKYYVTGLKIADKLNDKNSMAIFYSNIGALNIDKGNYSLANEYLLKAEQLCLSQSVFSTLIPVYKALGDLNALQGKGKKAREYYDIYSQLKDSLFSNDMAKQFSSMQTRYETNEKEAANKLLQTENELTKLELKRSNIIKWSLIVGLVLIILLFTLFYQNYTFKQKQLLDAERLQQQQMRSQAVLEAEEKERQRIARDLHDGLGQRLSATKLNIAGLMPLIQNHTPDQELLLGNALNLLDESVKEVRSISHNLLSNGLIKLGLISAVKEFVNQINTPAGLKINLETIGLEERLDPTIENVLYRVLQEIVNNIIKHAFATQVSIQIIKHEGELSLLVEDNGIGFNPILVRQNETGIGLKNIETRIEYIGGNVFFDSTPGKGTTVSIEVPLSI
ncbi:MAG: hypothetical protein CFE21_04550 [Bacteroidetes bacterium B1(2017)]|nr:MAG: hypothetical protein CFE21_04550 [Bacteroidetes bacterium B1(2017)]